MRIRQLGQFGIVATLIVLSGNLWFNLRAPDRAIGARPEGFPWPSDGLGEITIGVEGSFEIELEERVLTEDDAAERVPDMTVIGRDPRPERSGMGIREAQITSYSYEGLGKSQAGFSASPQVVVNAPTAWAPMKMRNGVSTLDRSRPWTFMEPVVTFPGLAGGKDFVLEANRAQLDPRNNEVRCPGRFVLRSPGLRIVGFGLRLDPELGELYFGETDGRLNWEMELADGGVIRGYADDGGSFRSIDDERLILQLNAKESCFLTLPSNAIMPGRLETKGMNIFLRSSGDHWQPERLEGQVSTHWTGVETTLSGGPCDANWDQIGQIQSLLIDGPIMGINLGAEGGWLTAEGGAHIDAASSELYLWRKVNVFHPESRMRAEWARIDQNQQVEAGGGVMTLNNQGMAMSRELHSLPDGKTMASGNVLVYPSAPELDSLHAPTLILSQDGSLSAPKTFALGGADGASQWKLSGQQLTAKRTPGTLVIHALGAIRCQHQDTVVLGDEVQMRGRQRITVTGKPAIATIPLEQGVARAQASRCVLIGEQIHLSGDPVIEIPAAALGLRGDRVFIHADSIRRDESGTWHLVNEVRFSGAMSGTARSASWKPGGLFSIQSRLHNQPISATMVDGSSIAGRADLIEAYPEGPVDLIGNVDAQQTPEVGASRRITGHRAHLEKESGWISGDARVRDELVDATARRIWWANAVGVTQVLHMEGRAKFTHQLGRGRAERIDYSPDGNYLELHSSARRLAWMSTEDGRKIEAEWIRVNLEQFLISSRNGSVQKGADQQ
jgi:hypothetical protein